MKSYLIYFLVLLNCNILLAGVYEDSLINIIRFSKNDSVKMENEVLLARRIYSYNIDSAINSMNRAIEIAHKNGYLYQRGQYLKLIGVMYYTASKYNLSVEYLTEAEAILSEVNHEQGLAEVQFYLGSCYNETGNYNKSIDSYYKSLKIYETLKDTFGIARTLNNLGINLEAMGENSSAYKLYLKSYKLKKDADDYSGMANAYINLGNIKLKQKQIDSSLYFHKMGLQAANLLRDDRLIVESLVALGENYLKQNDYNNSIKYFERALETFKKYNNDFQLSEVYNGLAKAYFKKNNIKVALNYIENNISNLKKTGATDLLKNAYLLLSEIRNENGDYYLAYDAMKEYAMLKDSIYDSEKLSVIAEMQEKYNSNKRQREIEDLKHKNELSSFEQETQQQLLIGVVVFSIIVSVLLILMIVMYRGRQKSNAKLSQSLKEKEVLIKEVHHRVKNNFQLISSLLNLQSDLITDNEALIAINEGRNRIASMALVHKNLYMTDDLTSIEMQNYIDQLLDSIISSSENTETSIKYNFDASNIKFDVDTSVPLGLIINELLTNSIKYAFKGLKEGEINLKLRQIDGNKYEMLFSDNGVGMPEDIDLDNLSSLGLELVQLLVAQLNGSVKYTVNNGTHFKINFNKI